MQAASAATLPMEAGDILSLMWREDRPGAGADAGYAAGYGRLNTMSCPLLVGMLAKGSPNSAL